MNKETLTYPNGLVKENGLDSGFLGEVHLPHGMKYRIPKAALQQNHPARVEIHLRVTNETLKHLMLFVSILALSVMIYNAYALNA
jgi:hypothetical protein